MVEVVGGRDGRRVKGRGWSCLIGSWWASGEGERRGEEGLRIFLFRERLLTLEARLGDREELRRARLACDSSGGDHVD